MRSPYNIALKRKPRYEVGSDTDFNLRINMFNLALVQKAYVFYVTAVLLYTLYTARSCDWVMCPDTRTTLSGTLSKGQRTTL